MSASAHDEGEDDAPVAFNLAILGASAGGIDAHSGPIAQLPVEQLERYVRVLGDELEQTRGQLKTLVTKYDAASEELHIANAEILSAKNKLKEAKRDLELANRAEAERANAAKNDFLALISHELRSPLNVISNWVQLMKVLRTDQGGDPRIAKGLETIDRSCKEQARLIDDLLDVSRITSGNLVLDLRPTDFAAVARSTLEGMTPIAERKNIAIAAAGFNEPLVLAGDTRRLQQIVANLLGNAIKFTPEGGHIDVALIRIDNAAELTVSDTGIGIPAEELLRIFGRFSQSDISKTRKYGGIGLGLSIVRNLTEAHGGKVAATSEGPDRGARFVVRLPLAPTPLSGAVERNAPSVPNEISLQGLSILVIDDEEAGRDGLAQMLTAIGAEVETASGAADALLVLKVRQFNALVSDIAMPDVNGYELISQIRKQEAEYGGSRIYAIALTGFTALSDRHEALAAGFDAHFGKPTPIPEIAARLFSGIRSLAAAKPGGG